MHGLVGMSLRRGSHVAGDLGARQGVPIVKLNRLGGRWGAGRSDLPYDGVLGVAENGRDGVWEAHATELDFIRKMEV